MDLKPASQLARLSVTVHCEIGTEGQELVRHLQRARGTVRHIWPMPETVGEDADLVLCECERGLARRLAWPPGEAKAALILLLPRTGQTDLAEMRAAAPDALLHRPYAPGAIDAAVLVALDQFGYARRLRHRIDRLEENIKALREIEKAKRLIMARQSLGEDEAFRLLRDLAMQRRITIAELAAKMIDS
jgi:AmiR/NasT family two-component response regulator